MATIISIHEYDFRPDVDPEAFEAAWQQAVKRGLFRLPGLLEYHLVRGVKGRRRGKYAAIWIYESREAWEKLWGTPEQPLPPQNYPESWRIWEAEILAPFLDRDPDRITYTTYESLQ